MRLVCTLAPLIGQPLLILSVALLWGMAALALPRSRQALVANAVAWLAFAGWEALVQAITPEANIRVDLLLIAPLLLGRGCGPWWSSFCGCGVRNKPCTRRPQPAGRDRTEDVFCHFFRMADCQPTKPIAISAMPAIGL